MLKSKCLVYVIMAVPVLLLNHALYISFIHYLKFQLTVYSHQVFNVEQVTKFYTESKFILIQLLTCEKIRFTFGSQRRQGLANLIVTHLGIDIMYILLLLSLQTLLCDTFVDHCHGNKVGV